MLKKNHKISLLDYRYNPRSTFEADTFSNVVTSQIQFNQFGHARMTKFEAHLAFI